MIVYSMATIMKVHLLVAGLHTVLYYNNLNMCNV